jgi:hypothetical protein
VKGAAAHSERREFRSTSPVTFWAGDDRDASILKLEPLE